MYFILVFFQRGLGPDADNDPKLLFKHDKDLSFAACGVVYE